MTSLWHAIPGLCMTPQGLAYGYLVNAHPVSHIHFRGIHPADSASARHTPPNQLPQQHNALPPVQNIAVQNYQPASLWRRVCAEIIDTLLICFVGIFFLDHSTLVWEKRTWSENSGLMSEVVHVQYMYSTCDILCV